MANGSGGGLILKVYVEEYHGGRPQLTLALPLLPHTHRHTLHSAGSPAFFLVFVVPLATMRDTEVGHIHDQRTTQRDAYVRRSRGVIKKQTS